MLISFNGSSYFDSNDVIGLSESTAFLREKSGDDPKVSAKIKVRLKNNDSVEIDAMLISIADVADAINRELYT